MAAIATTPITSAPFEVAAGPKQTRKSIKKYFPLGPIMAKGKNNPITLHSVNEDVFPRLWSFMAEVMVVDGELSRSTKEDVALMVSSKNQCPMCVTAHRMMGTAAKRAEKSLSKKDMEAYELQLALHKEVMEYAESLIDATLKARYNEDADVAFHDDSLSRYLDPAAAWEEGNATASHHRYLTDAGKAEIALVVVLYCHMNRIISAVLGEQMSHAMFSVPKSAAAKMESTSVMRVVNKIMAPLLAGGMKVKHKPGITSSLFPTGSSCLEYLPEHLKGAELAGEERANALARLVAWVEVYEVEGFQRGLGIPSNILQLLDDPDNAPPEGLRPVQLVQWATTSMRKIVNARLPDELSRAIANVLLLVSYSPQSVFNSIHWITVVKALGDDNAKTIVVWWSLRFTLNRSKGLRLPGSSQKKKENAGW